MAKEQVPSDVMTLLIALAHKPDKDADIRRIRFEATFSACNGQINDHPAMALLWLWKLHQGVTQTRQASIRASCRVAFAAQTRRSPEQTMILAAALVNESPSASLQHCAVSAFMKAFRQASRHDDRTGLTANLAYKALGQINDPELASRLKKAVLHTVLAQQYKGAMP